MERNVDVATGESVVFTYELAGLGSRFFAVAIDIGIQVFTLVVALALFVWLAFAVGSNVVVAKPDPFVKFADAVLVGLAFVALFMLFFGYFIIFEWRSQGSTPGKRLLGIRVVRDGGFPLDFTSAVVRNVVRILEFAAGFYTISAIATLLSPMNRRLGDMAAGTIVVRVSRFDRTITLASLLDAENVRDDALAGDLSESERDLVRRYVERRASLSRSARTSLAKQIADAVRPKLGASFEHLDDDDLLVHVGRTAK
jgi:uncharacterized RDD family membrane protein YckC